MSGYLSLADGRTLPVRNGFVIGRVAGCDLVIDDAKASRRHARIIIEADVVEVEDLDSSNGTLLNGKPVKRRLLRPGDQVQIGKTVLTYREGSPPTSPATSAAPAARQAAPVFDADDDLFAGAPTAAPAAPPAPRPATPPPSPSPPAAAPVPQASVAPSVRRPEPPPAPPPPAAPPRPAVVEFADEVVEVRKASPAPTAAKAMGPAAEPTVQRQQRVLQFSKQSGGGGLLGDDLSQMSSGNRSLVYAVALAAAIGLGWLVVWLVR